LREFILLVIEKNKLLKHYILPIHSIEFKPHTEPISAASIVSRSAAGSNKPINGASSGPARVKDVGSRVAKKCLEKGMLILTTSVFDVIRFIPALNVSKAEVDQACAIFKEALEEVAKEG
jgi:4-aminobutyrate aminotransferase